MKNKLIVSTALSLLLVFALTNSACSALASTNFDAQFEIVTFQNCSDLELVKEYVESGKVAINDKIFFPRIFEEVSPLYLVQYEQRAPQFQKYLLDAGADPNVAYGTRTLLMCNAGADNSVSDYEFGRMLIEYGADVNLQDDDGFTALDYAVKEGTYESIKYILNASPIITNNTLDVTRNKRANGHNYIVARKIFDTAKKQNVNYDKYKEFALAILGETDELIKEIKTQGGVYEKDIPFYAAAYCKSSALKYFVSDGFKLSQKDDNRNTLLWIAASAGNTDVVKFLIEKGVNLDFNEYRRYDEDPLKIAIANNHIDTAKLLLKKGARFNIDKALGFDGSVGTAQVGSEIVPTDSLQYVVRNGNFNTLHLLEKYDYPMNKNTYYRALEMAILYNQMDMIEYFLKKGTDPNYTDNRFADNVPILEICARYGNIENLKLLHKYGIKIKTNDSDALYYAVEAGNYDMAKYLLDNGMDVNAHVEYDDESGTFSTPWEAAAHHGYLDMIELLLEYGADINENYTHMLMFYARGSETITKYLIEHGSNVDMQDTLGDTALHWAALNHRTENTRMLLEAGADITMINEEGKTALVVAKEAGADEVVKLIEQYG